MVNRPEGVGRIECTEIDSTLCWNLDYFERVSIPTLDHGTPMKTIFFCVGYVTTWFFAGVALQVATFLAN
jgi:hypothetical protein